jgi:recombination associated protein RdgC
MWFSNSLIYRFTQPVPFTLDELTAGLESRLARPCGSQELNTVGWTTPFGKHSELLVEVVDGYWLVTLQKNERILPPGVIKEALAERVEMIEARDARKVYKRERDNLKDEIVMELLPRAFTRSRNVSAVIAPSKGWLIVDATTPARAEDLLSVLREATSSLPVRPLRVEQAPGTIMSSWITEGAAPSPFTLGDNCAMHDTDGGIVRCRRKDLSSEEIQQLLASGGQVSELGLHYEDKATFSLSEQLHLKQIKYGDLLRDDASEQGGDDHAGQLQATMAIMCGVLNELIDHLVATFGGEPVLSEGNGLEAPAAESQPADSASHASGASGLYDRAKTHVLSTKNASIVGMQRVLKTSFNETVRLLEQLEQAQVVSPPDQNGKRTVLA